MTEQREKVLVTFCWLEDGRSLDVCEYFSVGEPLSVAKTAYIKLRCLDPSRVIFYPMKTGESAEDTHAAVLSYHRQEVNSKDRLAVNIDLFVVIKPIGRS